MRSFLTLVLTLIFFTACKDLLGESLAADPTNRTASWNPKIETFGSCVEINDYLKSFIPDGVGGEPMMGTVNAGTAKQPYENQVEEVLEGDILQMNSDYFFFARPGSIEVIDRNTLAIYKTIPLETTYSRSLLFQDGKLIFIGLGDGGTLVKIFDARARFQKTYEKTFRGSLIDYRLVGQQLRVITQTYFYGINSESECRLIYKPNLENGVGTVTFVNQLDLDQDGIAVQTVGMMGGTNFIYMTKSELLLFGNSSWVSPAYFQVVNLGSESLAVKQVQTYEGSAKDRWSVFAKDQSLFVAATMRDPATDQLGNKIFAYEKTAKGDYEIASVTPVFGEREDIRAIHYLDDKAYVVTFEKTDPLFVFDIKDAKKIQMLSALESPGFSMQLRPLTNGMMLGLGYQASADQGFSWYGGIKVSLFDVLDPLKPTEIQTLPWGDRGSYAEATWEPKALFISREKDRIIFPATVVEKTSVQSPWDYGVVLSFSGALILDFRGRSVGQVGRITHQPLREAFCGKNAYYPIVNWNRENNSMDIQRAVETGGSIYSFSRFGAMRSSTRDFSTEQVLPFDTKSVDCRYGY